MNDSEFVSVLVAGQGPLRPSPSTLESIKGQLDGRGELIVVFGPNDPVGPEVVASIGAGAGIEPRVAHAVLPGLAGVMNAGVEAARGRFFSFLVGDDKYGEDRIAVFQRAERQLSRFDWGFSRVEGSTGHTEKAADPDLQRAIDFSRYPLEAVRELTHIDTFVSLGNLIVRTKTYRDVGGLREVQHFAAWDLALRLLEVSPPYVAERVLYTYVPQTGARNRGSLGRERAAFVREHRRRMATMTAFAGPGSRGGIRDVLDPDDEFAIKTTLWAMEKLRSAPGFYGLTRRAVRAARAVRVRR